MNEIYYGMASCNGLESFIIDETSVTSKHGSWFGDVIFGEEDHKKKMDNLKSMIWGMMQAAQANMQRRSVVFKATVSYELAEEIKELYKRDPEAALLLLKSEAEGIALAQTRSAKKFWDQIPNRILDPMN